MRRRKKEGGRRINEEGEDDRLLKADAVNEGDSERDRAILGGVVELRELVMAAFGSCGGDLEFGRLGFSQKHKARTRPQLGAYVYAID